ncbi:MAG: hypothetical protein ACOC4K_00520 [Verrucomicrobiota bacterium]
MKSVKILIHRTTGRAKPFLAAAFLLFAVLAVAPASAGAEAVEDTELYQKMEEMQSHYRTLGRGLRRPTADDLPTLLDAVQHLQLLTVETKSMTPYKAKSIEAEDRPAFVLAYRELQIKTLVTLLNMEEALLDSDFENANVFWDELKERKADGHEAFQENY